jgi:1,4-dihydroxy-2-naphthoate polyprenyltransferase
MKGIQGSKPFVMPFSDVVKLLRIPFSVFLLPVFLFALLPVAQPEWANFSLLFVLLHFFIYPASNAYNSYMDQDTESIGGLENPPKAGKELFYVSIVLDILGVGVAFFYSPKLSALLIMYSIISRLYSWRVTRIKKYPWLSFFTVALIQGGFTFMTANMFFTDQLTLDWFTQANVLGIIITSLLIGAFYPLTQIYQHKQDEMNGDRTLSYELGVKGTFVFTGILFICAIVTLAFYFAEIGMMSLYGLTLLFFMPGIVYFFDWAKRCFRNKEEANYRSAMKMNRLSSLLLIAGFIIIWILNQI